MATRFLIPAVCLVAAFAGDVRAQSDMPLVMIGKTTPPIKDVVQKTIQQANKTGISLASITVEGNPPTISQPAVMFEQFPVAPHVEYFRTIMKSLGKLRGPVTYLLFIDNAQDIDWIGSLEIPDNIRLAVSFKSLEGPRIVDFYNAARLKYRPAALTIDYTQALKMALAQISNGGLYGDNYVTKKWSSGKAYVGLFDDVVRSNAKQDAATQRLIQQTLRDTGVVQMTADLAKNGIEVLPQVDMQSSSDVHAVTLKIARSECVGDWVWDGFVQNRMEFQAFGVTRR